MPEGVLYGGVRGGHGARPPWGATRCPARAVGAAPNAPTAAGSTSASPLLPRPKLVEIRRVVLWGDGVVAEAPVFLHAGGCQAPAASAGRGSARSGEGGRGGGGPSRGRGPSRGGGRRGEVTGLSRASYMRLCRLLRRLDPLLLTHHVVLTYPEPHPADGRVVHAHLRALRERLRRWGVGRGFWLMEFQWAGRGGAPHFHLLVDGAVDRGRLARAWAEIVAGRGAAPDPKHLAAGTRVEPVRDWRRMVGYLLRDAGQARVPDGFASPGRMWGTKAEPLCVLEFRTEITAADAGSDGSDGNGDGGDGDEPEGHAAGGPRGAPVRPGGPDKGGAAAGRELATFLRQLARGAEPWRHPRRHGGPDRRVGGDRVISPEGPPGSPPRRADADADAEPVQGGGRGAERRVHSERQMLNRGRWRAWSRRHHARLWRLRQQQQGLGAHRAPCGPPVSCCRRSLWGARATALALELISRSPALQRMARYRGAVAPWQQARPPAVPAYTCLPGPTGRTGRAARTG